MRRIVALVEAMSAEQDRQFMEFLNEKGWGYWHWIDGAWLITAYNEDQSAVSTVRDKLLDVTKSHNSMVFEVDKVMNWSGYGPNEESSNMFKWIRKWWSS